jgi:hypothetical protein
MYPQLRTIDVVYDGIICGTNQRNIPLSIQRYFLREIFQRNERLDFGNEFVKLIDRISAIVFIYRKKKWLRSSAQQTPIFKWNAGGLKMQCYPRRREALATNRPTRWITRGTS